MIKLIKKNTFIKFVYSCLFLTLYSSFAIEAEIPKDLKAAKFITLIEKNDGFGCQLLRRMSAIAFAEFHNKTYLHMPFTEMQHNYSNDINFANDLECFANIGMGSVLKKTICQNLFYIGGKYWGYYVNSTTAIGYKLKERQEEIDQHKKNEYFGRHHFKNDYFFNGLPREALDSLLADNEQNPYVYAREDYLYYINQNVDAYFNENVIKILRNRYFSSAKEPIPYFKNNKINVAIHIRRGDVSAFANKDEYFLSIMDSIRKQFPTAFFHIFSEGDIKQFIKFQFNDVMFHLNEDIKTTFHALVIADILVTSKSAFSYTAALLSKGIVYHPKKYWNASLKNWIIKE